jgi:hypothetical protein
MQVPQTENYTEFGKGTLIGSGADFAAGAAGSLLEQAISGERMNAGRGILGGLSNAVSGAIFGNVPFKNAGQAFGKGALSGAATSGLGYLSDLVGRQPKSGQMRHFPGGTVARTPYERLTDPRGICVQQDIFGGGLGIRKAYGYRYEMRDPDQPERDCFDLGDFLMGGLSGVAFYGMDKAVGALKGSLSNRNECGSNRYINGQRMSKFHKLSEAEIVSLKNDIREIGADESVFKFNEGWQTGYSDRKGLIFVKGDVLPDMNSLHPRDLMSSKAVLAHEYYGHKYFGDLYGSKNPMPGAWNDEFRASYTAALNTPNLEEMDRAYLMLDALERAKEAGVNIKITNVIRRVLYGY